MSLKNPFNKSAQASSDLLYLAVLSSFFLLFDLGKGSLASWDEAIYAEAAKQVLLSGDWLRLTWNGTPWVEKPPLGVWATAFFHQLFGVGEFSSRFFSAISGTGTVLVTYLLGRSLFDRRIGLLSAGVLISSMHFFRMVRFGMLDGPITFFIALSLYWFWLGRTRERYLLLSGAAFGLALMAKSFVAVFIPMTIWIYCWAAGEWRILRKPAYLAGMALGALPLLAWSFYQMGQDSGGFFLRESVMKHLLERTTQAMQGHDHNAYFYIRTVINKFRPWIVVGVFSAPFFLFQAVRTRAKEPLLTAVWMFSIFTVITLMRTKLHWYTLPFYPPLAISVGYCLARLLPARLDLLIKPVFILIMVLHVPVSNIFRQDYAPSIKGIAPAVKQVPPEEPVFLYNYHEQPAAVFYWDRKKTLYLDSPEELKEALRGQRPLYLFAAEQDLRELSPELAAMPFTVIGEFEDVRLLKVGA